MLPVDLVNSLQRRQALVAFQHALDFIQFSQ